MEEPRAEMKCLLCGKTDDQLPLISMNYQGATRWICSPHLPILIHEPAQLIGKLPGAEDLPPAEHHD